MSSVLQVNRLFLVSVTVFRQSFELLQFVVWYYVPLFALDALEVS